MPLKNYLIKRALGAVESVKDAAVTVHVRPLSASQIGTASDPSFAPVSCGIVMQGPLRIEDHFTLETVKLYRQHYPTTPILLSTWDDEPKEALKACEAAGARLILNKKPASSGPFNINFQLVSSRAGVEMCRELGLRHALKTRTDQRMYAPNVLGFLSGLLETFPLKAPGVQKKRIVGLDCNTFKFRRYGLSDMFVFGTTDDMLLYWGCDLDTRAKPAALPFGEYSKMRVCEVYIVTEFLKRIGRAMDWTMLDSWRVYGENFCVVDKETVDLYWPKYTKHLEHRNLVYEKIICKQELSFRDWLQLYLGNFDAGTVPENAIKLDWDERVF